MREQSDAQEHSAAGLTNSVPWTVIDVRTLPRHRLAVRFVDGTNGEVDMSELIFSQGAGVFDRLRDPGSFASAHIEHGTVCWPGDLDLAPDAMYDAIRADGIWRLV